MNKRMPANAAHHEEAVEESEKESVVKPVAPSASPIEEESVHFSKLQQDIALGMAQSAAIPNDLVRQLLSLENRKDAFVQLAGRAGESLTFKNDVPYDPIANVIICPQLEGPPLFAVFRRAQLQNGRFSSTAFSLVDSNGEFHKIYYNHTMANGIFQDINDDTVVDKIDDLKVPKDHYKYWYRLLTIVPMTKAPQHPALMIIMNPDVWTWRGEATGNPNIMKIHIGPKPKEGEMMTPAATWVWDATQKSYVGPDGGIGYPFMRISARDYAAHYKIKNDDMITPFIAQFSHQEGYPPSGTAKSMTSPSSDRESSPGVSKTLTSGSSPLTPALEAIVGALKAKKGQMVNLRKELATHRKDFVGKDFKALPSEKMLAEILEVKKEHLMMAFISVMDEGAVPCATDSKSNWGYDDCVASEEVYALHIVRDENGRDRLAFRDWDSEMKLFGSMSKEVVFPKAASQVPVIEVHYDIDDVKLGFPYCDTVKVVEVYHLAMQKSITGKVFAQNTECSSGENTEIKTKFIWVPSKVPGRVFLLNVSLYAWQAYCTGDDDDPDEPGCHQVTCERNTKLYIVTSDNFLEPSEKEMEEFRKIKPGLAKLLPDAKGETEKECKNISHLRL